MIISLVAALGENGEIGQNNQLPWRLSDDLKNFKKHTMGKPIAMGRNTFESIGRPLPGRENIVLTRDKSYRPEGVTVKHSLAELFAYCEGKDTQELAVIGGDQIFRQTMEKADLLYLTEVHGAFKEADAFFPSYEQSEWEELESFSHPKDDKNDHAWTFRVLKRRA